MRDPAPITVELARDAIAGYGSTTPKCQWCPSRFGWCQNAASYVVTRAETKLRWFMCAAHIRWYRGYPYFVTELESDLSHRHTIRVDEPDAGHADALDEQDNPPWPPADAKPGDVWGAYRLESDGWWRLAPPNSEIAASNDQT